MIVIPVDIKEAAKEATLVIRVTGMPLFHVRAWALGILLRMVKLVSPVAVEIK